MCVCARVQTHKYAFRCVLKILKNQYFLRIFLLVSRITLTRKQIRRQIRVNLSTWYSQYLATYNIIPFSMDRALQNIITYNAMKEIILIGTIDFHGFSSFVIFHEQNEIQTKNDCFPTAVEMKPSLRFVRSIIDTENGIRNPLPNYIRDCYDHIVLIPLRTA